MQKQGLRFQGFINNWVAELNRTTEEDRLQRVLLEEDLGIDSAGGDALGRPWGLGQLQLGVGQVLLGDPRLKDTTHSLAVNTVGSTHAHSQAHVLIAFKGEHVHTNLQGHIEPE